MTQPEYVPLAGPDRVRPSDRLTIPGAWQADRPSELSTLTPPTGDGFGLAGPDLGYGLKLAKRFVDRLVLTAGEHAEDAVAGCFACGAKRAATIGRAPVIYDMTWAYTLWGYLAPAPDGLVERRVPLFRGASHDYATQRAVVDELAEATFLLSPEQVAERVGDGWQAFFATS